MRFGPMHYRDVAVFVGVGCREGGEYEYDQTDAVGQAFRTYIVPRLLNAAAELAERELEQERRQMGSYE
nr:hypothetical protein [Natronomonas sp. LN261]